MIWVLWGKVVELLHPWYKGGTVESWHSLGYHRTELFGEEAGVGVGVREQRSVKGGCYMA